MNLLAIGKDRPGLVTLGAAGAVVAHRLAYDVIHVFPDVASAMNAFDNAWSIYLGFAAVVAVTGGFAGVIVVFTLSSESRPFRRFRILADDRLSANLVSPIAAAFVAAIGSVVCAVLSVSGHGQVAWWTFEFLLIISAVSGIRMLWLVRRLIELVNKNDADVDKADKQTSTVSLAQLHARKKDSA